LKDIQKVIEMTVPEVSNHPFPSTIKIDKVEKRIFSRPKPTSQLFMAMQ
jgi:hypothetical protein